MVTLKDVFARRDFDAFLAVLDPNVVWQGIGPETVCQNREEAREFLRTGKTGWPEIIAEADGRFVVDPRPDPPPELAPELCQVFTMSAGKVIRIDDYPTRKSALEAVGL